MLVGVGPLDPRTVKTSVKESWVAASAGAKATFGFFSLSLSLFLSILASLKSLIYRL